MTENYIKFAYICLCFLIALGSYWFCRSKKDWAWLSVAMGFTLISDYFLVIARNYPFGVFTFCFVHMLYIYRVTPDSKKTRLFGFAVAVLINVLVFLVTLRYVPALIAYSAIYATLFSINLIVHIKYYRNGGPNRHIMLLGLILFALCDIHVLMFNLPQFVPAISPEIGVWGLRWIWFFYAPSQMLLSLSAVKWRQRRLS